MQGTRIKLDNGLEEILDIAKDAKVRFDMALDTQVTAAERISNTIDAFLEGVTYVMAAVAMVGVTYLAIKMWNEFTSA